MKGVVLEIVLALALLAVFYILLLWSSEEQK